jgi:hypothetical protein
MKKLIDEVKYVVEVKKNFLVIFHIFEDCVSLTFHAWNFTLFLFNVENKETRELNNSNFSDRNFGGSLCYFNYIINDGFLFVNYAFNSDIYDINKNMELVKQINYELSPIKIFYCNYVDDLFVV